MGPFTKLYWGGAFEIFASEIWVHQNLGAPPPKIGKICVPPLYDQVSSNCIAHQGFSQKPVQVSFGNHILILDTLKFPTFTIEKVETGHPI